MIAAADLSFGFSLSDASVAAAADVYHPAATLEDALDAVMYSAIGAAILSVCIHGEECFVVAEHLLRRKIPFAFALSANSFDIPEVFAQIPRMLKSDMIDQLPRLLGFIGTGHPSRDTLTISIQDLSNRRLGTGRPSQPPIEVDRNVHSVSPYASRGRSDGRDLPR
ncbi:hypothetical protein ACWGTI_28960 [Mesorhizobium sp. ArgA1]